MTSNASDSRLDDPSSEKVVLGLGNPGERYAGTRHNLGFRVVEELARRHRLELRELCNSRVAKGAGLSLAAPSTFMNRSGYAARCLLERWAVEPGSFLVVYDEAHLPLGKLRLRGRGSPAGHKGMESVLESLGTDRVPRLRMGIAPETLPSGSALPDFVLAPFTGDERPVVEEMVLRAADACELWASQGVESAMQSFNG